MLRAAGEKPAALGDCLSVLGILVAEGRKADREGLAAYVMSGLREHAARAEEAGRGPPPPPQRGRRACRPSARAGRKGARQNQGRRRHPSSSILSIASRALPAVSAGTDTSCLS